MVKSIGLVEQTDAAVRELLARGLYNAFNHAEKNSARADDLLSSTIMKGELEAFVTEPKFFDQEIFHNVAFVSEIQ